MKGLLPFDFFQKRINKIKKEAPIVGVTKTAIVRTLFEQRENMPNIFLELWPWLLNAVLCGFNVPILNGSYVILLHVYVCVAEIDGLLKYILRLLSSYNCLGDTTDHKWNTHIIKILVHRDSKLAEGS